MISALVQEVTRGYPFTAFKRILQKQSKKKKKIDVLALAAACQSKRYTPLRSQVMKPKEGNNSYCCQWNCDKEREMAEEEQDDLEACLSRLLLSMHRMY